MKEIRVVYLFKKNPWLEDEVAAPPRPYRSKYGLSHHIVAFRSLR
jgi:hypothetical protein